MPFLGKAPVQAATDLQIDGSTINNATIANSTITAGTITSTTIDTATISNTSVSLDGSTISNCDISAGTITSTTIDTATLSNTSVSLDGGTISNCDISGGSITHSSFIEKKVAATSGTGTKTYNLNDGSSFEHTANGVFTANFTNVPGTHTTSWTLEVNNGGTAYDITWNVDGDANTMIWSEGVIPPPSTGTDLYSFISVEGTVYGSLAMRNAS